jgi:hypothetical protein
MRKVIQWQIRSTDPWKENNWTDSQLPLLKIGSAQEYLRIKTNTSLIASSTDSSSSFNFKHTQLRLIIPSNYNIEHGLRLFNSYVTIQVGQASSKKRGAGVATDSAEFNISQHMGKECLS